MIKRFKEFNIPSTETWKGSAANVAAAQAALYHRARCNSLAVQRKYAVALEKEIATV